MSSPSRTQHRPREPRAAHILRLFTASLLAAIFSAEALTVGSPWYLDHLPPHGSLAERQARASKMLQATQRTTPGE